MMVSQAQATVSCGRHETQHQEATANEGLPRVVDGSAQNAWRVILRPTEEEEAEPITRTALLGKLLNETPS